jgi:hypothetical protein
MNEIERRLRKLADRLSAWWNSNATTAKQETTARAQQAASRAKDFRASDRGQRAASKLSDLRDSETAKRAEAAFNDLRTSDAAKKAETALTDLRQREPVKKAEESARKVMHDLFSGNGSAPAGDR